MTGEEILSKVKEMEWDDGQKEFASLCIAAITLILTQHKKTSSSGNCTQEITFASSEARQSFDRLLGDIMVGDIPTNPNVYTMYLKMRACLEAVINNRTSPEMVSLSQKIQSLLALDDYRKKCDR